MTMKRLYVHSDRSAWVIVTEVRPSRFLHEFSDGTSQVFGTMPPPEWDLMSTIQL